MNIIQKTSKISTIALILVLAVSTLSTFLATVNAADIPTYAFIAVSPDPIGVGQEVVVMFWLSMVPPTAAGSHGDRWEGMTVKVTKPDGTKQTLGPFTSDPVGSAWTMYVPDQTGTYTFQMNYPGQHITGVGALIPLPIDNEYLPSTSLEADLTVQANPTAGWPAAELPTGYWQRPINGENREWYQIAGNWLGAGGNRGSYDASGDSYFGGGFNPYTTAPNTAHIVWTKPLAFGGIMGGTFGGGGTSSYYDGMNYEPKFDPPVIINGVLYYNTPSPPIYGFFAVDLRTGEELWWQNSTGQLTMSAFGTTQAYPGISFGQVYNYISPNQFGGIPYLWYARGSTWKMYDAFTGNWILNVANASAGTVIMSPMGDMLVYILNGNNNWLAMWNSSKVEGMMPITTQANGEWMWRPPPGATLDWRTGIQWNVTVPDVAGAQAIARATNDIILATTGNMLIPSSGWQMEIGYDAKTGEQLWVQNRTTIQGATSFSLMGPIRDGVYTEFTKETMTWSGYDAYTGEQLWGPTEPYTNAFGTYNTGAYIAYDKLYAEGYDGMVHCYDVNTGEHLWDFFTGSSGSETVYGHWSLFSGPTIADGKVYVCAGHTHLQPLYRGAKIFCIDAETGEELWSVLGWMQSPVVADGYLVANNGYDNQLYCFGKGITATTVDAPLIDVPLGSNVVVRGTVTDQSPGKTCLGIPAAGTPAISDEDMSAWMEYLYMQQPCPDNAEGVEVVLTTLDPNGNTYELGRTTTAMSGTFGIAIDPPVPGLYKIIATFEGSDAYYGSYAETYINVAEAPSVAQPIEPEPAAPAPTEPTSAEPVQPAAAFTLTEPTPAEPTATTEAPLITTEIAIIAAVAVACIIGAVAFLALRKRK
jgi:outer membrane protein assembly factor BamB